MHVALRSVVVPDLLPRARARVWVQQAATICRNSSEVAEYENEEHEGDTDDPMRRAVVDDKERRWRRVSYGVWLRLGIFRL